MLLGLDNAGKTTLLKSLASEDVNAITPTQVTRQLVWTLSTATHRYLDSAENNDNAFERKLSILSGVESQVCKI